MKIFRKVAVAALLALGLCNANMQASDESSPSISYHLLEKDGSAVLVLGLGEGATINIEDSFVEGLIISDLELRDVDGAQIIVVGSDIIVVGSDEELIAPLASIRYQNPIDDTWTGFKSIKFCGPTGDSNKAERILNMICHPFSCCSDPACPSNVERRARSYIGYIVIADAENAINVVTSLQSKYGYSQKRCGEGCNTSKEFWSEFVTCIKYVTDATIKRLERNVDRGADESDVDKRTCTGCGSLSEKKLKLCEGCKVIKYCSRTCQKAHWGAHKKICPALNQRRKMRREEALANGACIRCYKDSEKKLKKCGRCGVARYCSVKCQKADWKDHRDECPALRKRRKEERKARKEAQTS